MALAKPGMLPLQQAAFGAVAIALVAAAAAATNCLLEARTAAVMARTARGRWRRAASGPAKPLRSRARWGVPDWPCCTCWSIR
jgi:heme O synthase-like polyprenyltransferase